MTPNEQRMMEVIDENREKVHKLAKKIGNSRRSAGRSSSLPPW